MPSLTDLVPPTTEDYIRRFQGATSDSQGAFEAAIAARQAADRGKAGDQRDLNLRDAEHALFSQSQIDQSPVSGRLAALIGVPAYTAGKVLSQTYGVAPGTIKALTGADASSTKPDLSELYWGLRPVFKSIRPSAPRSPREPDPEQP